MLLNKKKNIFQEKIEKIKKFCNKKIIKNQKKFSLKETIVFMLITFSFGLVSGGIIMYGKGMFGSNSLLYEFASTYNELVDSYFEDVEEDKLLESGISGMMRYLGDPYSTFMSKESASAFNESVEGVYYGIGTEVKYDEKFEHVYIGQVFEGSPASKVGLMEGDELIKVEGEEIKGKSLSQIASLVKGKEGTFVNITVIRDKEEKEFKIERGPVDSISVASKVIERDDNQIGYVAISVFANNTYEQLKNELEKLEKEGIDSLIIDVRGNSGGYLTSVTDIISLFTKKGDIIYKLKTKDKIEVIKDDTKESRDYRIVMLVDQHTASASEVLTGALKETYGAKVVGVKTFGKGKVQKVSTLSNGAMIKYTHQEWLTPNGDYIDGKGIEPDEMVIYTYDEKIPDSQLEKAIEVILEK